jgi:hypothetical protein
MPAYRTVEYIIALFIMLNNKTTSLLMFSIKCLFLQWSSVSFKSVSLGKTVYVYLYN